MICGSATTSSCLQVDCSVITCWLQVGEFGLSSIFVQFQSYFQPEDQRCLVQSTLSKVRYLRPCQCNLKPRCTGGVLSCALFQRPLCQKSIFTFRAFNFEVLVSESGQDYSKFRTCDTQRTSFGCLFTLRLLERSILTAIVLVIRDFAIYIFESNTANQTLVCPIIPMNVLESACVSSRVAESVDRGKR